jgi:hypothetical protein
MIRTEEELLASLPIEIWTECEDGQALLRLARLGRCIHHRVNATCGRFVPIRASTSSAQDDGQTRLAGTGEECQPPEFVEPNGEPMTPEMRRRRLTIVAGQSS